MKRPLARGILPLLLAAQDRPAEESSNLPVKRVVLYKNGVGYFEHLGHVRDNQQVTVSFTSGQLNDVLKKVQTFDARPKVKKYADGHP